MEWIKREKRRIKSGWRQASPVMVGWFVLMSWLYIPLYVIGLITRFVVWYFVTLAREIRYYREGVKSLTNDE